MHFCDTLWIKLSSIKPAGFQIFTAEPLFLLLCLMSCNNLLRDLSWNFSYLQSAWRSFLLPASWSGARSHSQRVLPVELPPSASVRLLPEVPYKDLSSSLVHVAHNIAHIVIWNDDLQPHYRLKRHGFASAMPFLNAREAAS